MTTTNTIIRRSATSTTGYEIVFDNQVLPIEKKVLTKKGDDYSLVLPENPSNRQYFTIGRVEANGGEIELTYKESRQMGEKSSTPIKTPKTDKIREYLTDEEKAIYDDLIKKAQKRAERAATIAEIERLQKALADTEEV